MRLRIRRVAGALSGVAAICLVCSPIAASAAQPPAAAQGRAGDASKIFTVTDDRITESSGLAVSRRHAGIVYTHNDSGATPQIFAIGPDGRTKATFTISGANARDWEGMSMGKDDKGRPALFVADIGDNLGGAWPYVTVYRVTEPATMSDQTLRATAYKLRYEDGPRNAESVLINPRTNRLYIASKLFSGALYEAPAELRTGRYNKLRKVGDAPPIATDGAFAPDGRSFVIRTYLSAHVYAFSDKDRKPGKQLRVVSLPGQEQGESITYSADGRALLAGSEGGRQPVWQMPLPEEARPTSASRPQGGDQEKSGGGDSKGKNVGLFVVLGVAAAIGYGVVRRRS